MLTVLARWCVYRRNFVLVGWLALLVTLAGVLGLAGTAFGDNTKLPSSDSASAYTLLAAAGSHAASGTSGTIVWRASSASAVSAEVRADIAPMLREVARVDGVVAIVSPFTRAGSDQVSADGRTAYATVLFDSTAHTDRAEDLAEHAARTGLSVQTGGKAFTNQIPSEASEVIGVLAALLVLLVVFRSVWAAALPIITGVAGVAASSLIVMVLSHVLAMSDLVISMSALVGLGVGIDYALFIVNRHRAALRDGADVATAIAVAVGTSGRAVLFAGATVVVALLGMLVLGVGFLTGIAVAAAITVTITVAAAITLLPALLAKIGLRVLRRRDRTGLATDPAAERGNPPRRFWAAWARGVQRRPRTAALAGGALLVALAVPALAIRLGSSDASSDPAGTKTHSYYATMSSAFGDGFESQLLLVAQTPGQQSRLAWARLLDTVSRQSGVASVSAASAVGGADLSLATVTPTTTSQAKATAELVSTLRSEVIPAAETGTGLRVHVGGSTATSIDFADALTAKLPLFLAIIAALGFALLIVAFRSLLIPAIGAVGNLVTIAVALGATVALFEWGWGPSLVGVGGGAPVEYVVAILIVGVMFGLSMDYHVFLVSRMHEEWVRTGDHHGSVRAGVRDAGQVIATAATIMGCVFVSFGFAGMRTAAEFGVGLAVAVLADALLLRMTVVPAVLHLLGRRSWALPQLLDKVLPHVSIEGGDHDEDGAPAGSPVGLRA